MRLIVPPSTPFFAAVAATQIFQRVSSTSAVANIDFAYDDKARKDSYENHSTYEECSLVVSSSLRGDRTDVGILIGCNDPGYICVEDVNSSLGGRCVASSTTKDRMLQNTPNPCTRCDGDGCTGLSDEFITNNIGEGSCCGLKACVNVSRKWRSWDSKPNRFVSSH